MRKTLIILNPAARGTRAQQQYEQICQLPGDHQVEVTEAPGHARVLAAQAAADGYETVVAAGGDGTINEVVNGLAGSETALGILPVGTINVFAAELSLPTKLAEAWRVIQASHVRKVDLALANDRYFAQLAGVGLDAQVVKETPTELKSSLGPISYLLAAAQVLARKPPRMAVTTDHGTLEGCFVLVGNGRFYGGRLRFFLEARMDDGLLDVLIVQKVGHLDLARYFAHIITGQLMPKEDVIYQHTRSVRVECLDCQEPVPVEVDGDLAMETPVQFTIAPKALRVLVAPPVPA